MTHITPLGQNGGMYVSAEMITTIVSVAGLFLALAGAFGWLIHRMDHRMDVMRKDLGDDLKAVRQEVADVRHDMAGLRQELIEVKVAVARLEGPLAQRLALPR